MKTAKKACEKSAFHSALISIVSKQKVCEWVALDKTLTLFTFDVSYTTTAAAAAANICFQYCCTIVQFGYDIQLVFWKEGEIGVCKSSAICTYVYVCAKLRSSEYGLLIIFAVKRRGKVHSKVTVIVFSWKICLFLQIKKTQKPYWNEHYKNRNKKKYLDNFRMKAALCRARNPSLQTAAWDSRMN